MNFIALNLKSEQKSAPATLKHCNEVKKELEYLNVNVR